MVGAGGGVIVVDVVVSELLVEGDESGLKRSVNRITSILQQIFGSLPVLWRIEKNNGYFSMMKNTD